MSLHICKYTIKIGMCVLDPTRRHMSEYMGFVWQNIGLFWHKTGLFWHNTGWHVHPRAHASSHEWIYGLLFTEYRALLTHDRAFVTQDRALLTNGKVCVKLGRALLKTNRLRFMQDRAFVDGYCSTVQALLDWFEVCLGSPELCFKNE